jgi:hypothetical protein
MLKMSERQINLRGHDLVLSVDELWWRCFALGTMNTALELEAFLRGTAWPTRHEYNVLAVALNEYLVEIGLTQCIPYIEDDGSVAVSRPRSAAIRAPNPSSLLPRDIGA